MEISMKARSNNQDDESEVARDARRAAEHAKYIARREEDMSVILRMMLDVKQSWRRCTEPSCRRGHRCCGGPDFTCIRIMRPVRATKEEKDKAMAELHAALQVRLRELENEKKEGDSARVAKADGPARSAARRKMQR
jgi:hypothetical protein